MNYSIIIPIYNTKEELLKYNLKILLNLKREDVEIILIDDGSKSYINQICSEFVNRDKRFRYFKIENSGVSNARNVGIEKSSGDNLIFLDADDFLESKTIEELPNSNMFDIIVYDYILKYESGKNKIFNIGIEYGEYFNKKIKIIKEKIATSFAFNTIHSKIYKKDKIINNQIKFPNKVKIGEDLIFNLQYFSKCENFKYEKKILTHYRIYNTSSVRNFTKERFLDFEAEYDSKIDFIKKENIEKECVTGVYNYYQYLLFSNVLNSIISGISLEDIYIILEQEKYQKIIMYKNTKFINRLKMFIISKKQNKFILLKICKLKQMKGKI